jgi:hypothetical protein
MTAAEMSARMSAAELMGWIAHDELTAFEREMAHKEAEMKARARG